MENDKIENEVLIKQIQVEALNECGYNISREYTTEQLNSFVQAETLKNIAKIKKLFYSIAFGGSVAIFIAIILLLASIFTR